jgi:hypothetical protein
MRGEVRKVGGVAHSLAWLTRLSNTLGRAVLCCWRTKAKTIEALISEGRPLKRKTYGTLVAAIHDSVIKGANDQAAGVPRAPLLLVYN